MVSIPIRTILTRLSDDKWKTIIGDSWIVIKDVIGYLQNQNAYVDFALEMQEPFELIRDEKKRKIIFRALTNDEIDLILIDLGITNKNNNLSTLTSLKISKGSRIEKQLFDIFEIQQPTVEIIEETQSLENIKPNYALFKHQRKMVLRAMEYVHNNQRLMIHMPTGSGKTRVAMNIVSRILQTEEDTLVMWLVYNEELCNQAADEFIKAWNAIGDRDIDLLRFYGNHTFKPIKHGLIVASLGKLWAAIKKDKLFISKIKKENRISLIVFDEAHQSIAKTYMDMVDELIYVHNCNLIGLSATPGRSYTDIDEDQMLSKNFGSNKIKMEVEGYSNPVSYLIENGYLSKTFFKKLKLNTTFTEDEKRKILNDLDISEKMLKKIGNDTARNLEIIKATIELINNGNNRLILFAPSIENAKLMASLLKTNGFDAYAITSKTPKENRTIAIEKFKSDNANVQILCNYNVLSTGFDAPQTDAVIISRPTKSLVLYSQMVGRAIRGPKVGGTKEATVLTVVDVELPGFGSITEAFDYWEEMWNE